MGQGVDTLHDHNSLVNLLYLGRTFCGENSACLICCGGLEGTSLLGFLILIGRLVGRVEVELDDPWCW